MNAWEILHGCTIVPGLVDKPEILKKTFENAI
jgi:hypothetical protein